jgi:hypothetical protein
MASGSVNFSFGAFRHDDFLMTPTCELNYKASSSSSEFEALAVLSDGIINNQLNDYYFNMLDPKMIGTFKFFI